MKCVFPIFVPNVQKIIKYVQVVAKTMDLFLEITENQQVNARFAKFMDAKNAQKIQKHAILVKTVMEFK